MRENGGTESKAFHCFRHNRIAHNTAATNPQSTGRAMSSPQMAGINTHNKSQWTATISRGLLLSIWPMPFTPDTTATQEYHNNFICNANNMCTSTSGHLDYLETISGSFSILHISHFVCSCDSTLLHQRYNPV